MLLCRRELFPLSLTALAFLGSIWAATPAPVDQRLDGLPLRFEENRGQAPGAAPYIARGLGYAIALDQQGSILELQGSKSGAGARVRTRFIKSNPKSTLAPSERLSGATNYLRGQDSSRWLIDVPAFARVSYRSVWPGIDLVFYGKNRQLEYDFVLQPGADPSRIQFQLEGADRTRLNKAGDLVIATSAGEIRWLEPVVYQDNGGVRTEIHGSYKMIGRNRVGFAVARYDRTRPLVIDPVLSYSTYIGGAVNDSSRSIAVDSIGNVYIAGATTSRNLPVTGSSIQTGYGGESGDFFSGDAFVAKLNASGSSLIYLTYLGGSADDAGLALALDANNNAYVTGFTNSPDFPTTAGASRTTFQGKGGNQLQPGGDAFVTKLNAQGTALTYSSYLGGSQDEWGVAIAVDSTGSAYVAGITLSTNFPVSQGALQTNFRGGGGMPLLDPRTSLFNGGDGFVAKMNPAGSALTWATYLGGAKDDIPTTIALDSTNNVFVAGSTLSSDFPTTTGAYQTTHAGEADDNFQPGFKLGDGFVSKISAAGTTLIYSTLLGGSRDDGVFSIAVDKTGAVYATGTTSSLNFPVSSTAIQKTYKGPANPTSTSLQSTFFYGDAFVAKLNPAGSNLVYSTYLGGSGDDAGWGIRVDDAGFVYIAGQSNSTDFPVTDTALQKTFGGAGGQSQPIGDGILVKLSPAGDSLLYSSYIGGAKDDTAAGIAIDATGNVYLTGAALSTNFPISASAAQKTFAGAGQYAEPFGDAFVAKITGLPGLESPIRIDSVLNGASYANASIAAGEVVTLFGKGLGPATLVLADFSGPGNTLQTSAGGAKLLFDGVAAPLVYASDKQLSAIVPYEVASKNSTQVVVDVNGVQSAPLTLSVAQAAPGLFSISQDGTGQGAIYNQDGTVNGASNPAHPDEILVLYGTGEGQTNPAGVNGKIAADPFPQISLPLSITIDDKPATDVRYAGGVPGVVAGVFQINVVIPQGITEAGNKKVVVKIAGASSQGNLTAYIAPAP